MYRWICGFYQKFDSCPRVYPDPIDGRRLWKDSTDEWVCGAWKQEQIIVLLSNGVKLAILGSCFITQLDLKRLFEESIVEGNYNRLAALPGSYSLIIHDQANLYLYVDAAGLKPFFYTEYSNLITYSSLAISLQQLKNASIDESWIASSLTGYASPILTLNRSPFKDIYSVPPGHYLQISSEDIACERYWHEPRKYIDFSTAKKELRAQLVNVVEGRIQIHGNVSSDLSGGFDSTSLSLIAANFLHKRGQILHTITMTPLNVDISDDARIAHYATSLYTNINPSIIEEVKLPTEYSNLKESPLTDAPSIVILLANRFRYISEIIRSKNSQIHLSGVGGDSVLSFPFSYLSELFNFTQIKKFFRYVYAWSQVWNLPPTSLAKNAIGLNFISYNQWLLHQAKQFSSRHFSNQSLANEILGSTKVGWNFLPGGGLIADWYTERTVDLVAEEVRIRAKGSLPFADSPGQNESITMIHHEAYENRNLQQIYELHGINLEFPFLDSTIIDLCLSVRPEERTNPFQYKLLLSESLKQDLPNGIFDRNTKDDYSSEHLRGLKSNAYEINLLLENSILHDMHLIDVDKFRGELQQACMGVGGGWHFLQTLAIEIWLRQVLSGTNIFWKSKNTHYT
jgi:asparagine synthase (glutamine-hydrolysing)